MHRSPFESLEHRRLLAFPVAAGGPAFDYATEIAHAPDGSIVVGGLFSGTVNFDPGGPDPSATTLSSNGVSDIFVAKYSSAGELVWARSFGGNLGDFEIELDFDEAVDVAIYPERIGGEIFVNPVGAQPDEAGEYLNGLAVGPAGEIYFTGAFLGQADFDPGPGQRILSSSDFDYYDIMVVKLTPGGQLVWANQFGGRFTDVGNDIALDSAGNPYVAGLFTRDADFNPSSARFTVTAAGRGDAFVMKLSVNGRLIWVAPLGGEGTDRFDVDSANALAVDPAGNVYVTGTFAYRADFNPTPGFGNEFFVDAVDATDAFTALISTNGKLVWVHSWGGEGFDGGRAIALDANSSEPALFTVGYFEVEIDVDPGPGITYLTAAPEERGDRPPHTDLLVTRYDPADGSVRWVKQVGGGGYETVSDMKIVNGNPYFTGGFYGTADFNPGRDRFDLVSTPLGFEIDDRNVRGGDRVDSYDVYVAGLSREGQFLSAFSFGGREDDFGFALAWNGIAAFPNTIAAAGRIGGLADFQRGPGQVLRDADGRGDIFAAIFDVAGNVL